MPEAKYHGERAGGNSMMRTRVLACSIGILFLCTGGVMGQGDEVVLIDDFEGSWMTWSPNGQEIDYTDERKHGGDWSMYVWYDQAAAWQYCSSSIPEPLDFTVSPTMDFSVWVYWEEGWEEDAADIRLDVGPVILGHQTVPVANEWVEMVWTADRYSTPLLDEVTSFGWFFDPQEASSGLLYLDDFTARPSAVGEWEETLIYGWNEGLEGWAVDQEFNADEGDIWFETADPPASEGDGCLAMNYIGDYRRHTSKTIYDGAAGINEVDLTQYQQIVLDVYMQGTQPPWGQMTLGLKVWGGDDEPDEENGFDFNWIGPQTKRVTGAMDRWITMLWDYDPAEFEDNYADPNSRIDFTLVTHADAGVHEGTWMFVDNLRLARPAGEAAVADWSIH